mmetsp:Transcript_22080/g.65407  ORF Transcript_22080/g.65407 Transcript_22080/m.65407 type:complete len:785 (-) Transcript_22080:110-2464(-)
MASIVGGLKLQQRRPPARKAGGRRRAARAAVALASASALAGSAILILSDYGGSGFFGTDAVGAGSGRAAVLLGTEPDADGLITLRMYSASHPPPNIGGEESPSPIHRRATISGDEIQGFGEGPASPSPPQHTGLHFVDMYVGKPAQRRTLAVMTGSDFTAFPCGDCSECPPSINQFQSTQSPSFAKVPCGQCLPGSNGQTCSPDGKTCVASEKQPDRSSWSGYEAKDVALLGAPRSVVGTDAALRYGFPLTFSCQTMARGRFASQIRDGVVSFSSAPTSFVAQMHEAGKLRRARFSLCFEQSEVAAPFRQSSEGLPPGPSADAGAVTLGGFDPYSLETPMSYAQSVAARSAPGEGAAGYRVRVTGMYLREGGGPSIRPDHDIGSVRLRRVAFNPDEFNSEGGGMAVDSGALHTVLHAGAEESFKEMWNRSTQGKEFTSGKVFLTDEELNALPIIILQFKAFDGVDTSLDPNTIPNMAGDLDPDNPRDVLIAIPPKNYMEWNPASGAYRARISFEYSGGAVLGSNAMQGHTILYDLEKRRVGFAESKSCEKVEQRNVEDMDDDLYAVEEETGESGVHMVEGTLTDDDVFGVPVESSAAAATASNVMTEKNPLVAGDAAPISASPGKTPIGDAPPPNENSPSPNAQVPPLMGPGGSAAALDKGEEDSPAPKVENTGSCTSVSCRVWVGVGYFFVGCCLAIVYRTAKTTSLKNRQRKAEEEEQMRRLEYNQYSEKEVWEGPPQGEKEVWEGPPRDEERVYGSEVQKDLYDLEEVDEEYDREMPADWR